MSLESASNRNIADCCRSSSARPADPFQGNAPLEYPARTCTWPSLLSRFKPCRDACVDKFVPNTQMNTCNDKTCETRTTTTLIHIKGCYVQVIRTYFLRVSGAQRINGGSTTVPQRVCTAGVSRRAASRPRVCPLFLPILFSTIDCRVICPFFCLLLDDVFYTFYYKVCLGSANIAAM